MIRRAEVTDVSGISRLQRVVEAEQCLWGFHADAAEVWRSRDLSWTLLHDVDGDVVAFVHCLPKTYRGAAIYPAGSRVLEVVELMVAPSHRGQEVGGNLVRAIKAQALGEGFTHLHVYSAAKRFDDILRFYRECGFEPWHIVMTQKLDPEV
jgi:GNAT superfamily N-acetyltransferase